MKHKWSLIAFAAAAAIAMAAETLKVERDEVALRGTPDTYGKAIATMPKGTTLNVVEQNKSFAKVDFNGTVGWVRLKDLKPRENVANNDAGAGRGLGDAAPGYEVGAGKGLGDRGTAYGKAVGGDATKIDKLIVLRQDQIDSGAWQKWAAEGKVGAAAKGGN